MISSRGYRREDCARQRADAKTWDNMFPTAARRSAANCASLSLAGNSETAKECFPRSPADREPGLGLGTNQARNGRLPPTNRPARRSTNARRSPCV